MRDVRLLSISILAVLIVFTPDAGRAEGYPSKPIRFICTFAPGGGTDITARVVGQKLSEMFGQPVVVENRPGAGGTIGAASVAKAPPDGYTIMLGSVSPLVIAPFLFKKLPYDPATAFAPVTLIAIVPDIMVVHPSLPAKSVQELIELARSKPHQLTFSSSGVGGSGHLAGELLKSLARIDMIHVPYKGAGPAMTAVLSGEVSLSFPDAVLALSHLQSGKLRVLAVTSLHRLSMIPDVPTVAETLPGFLAGPWYSVVVPAGTPQEIVTKLNSAVREALRSREVSNTLTKQGAELIGNSPAEFEVFLQQERKRWGGIIKKAGIHAD